MTATPRPATTILLLRPAATGFEVFLVQRHRRSGFLPNAWVFPGGRVDEGDRLAGHPAVRGGRLVLEQLELPRDEGVAYAVAGVRETFEEAGIWLGEGSLPDDARGPLNNGELVLTELLATHGATVDLDRLRVWSWWVTPEAEPRRYDTRFLVAVAEGVDGSHDDHETVASGWFDPRQIMADASIERFPMAPPTWWTLRELSQLETVEDVLRAATLRPRRPISPVMNFGPDGLVLLLPGHPDHPEDAMPGLPSMVTFDAGHWVAHVDGERLVL